MGFLEEKYEKILHQNGIKNSISKVTVKEAPNLAGEHFCSVCQYATVEFVEEDIKPLNIFIKNILPSSSLESNLEFIKEGNFLTTILEEFKSICGAKNSVYALALKEELESILPKTFYADKNEIIMEDLSSKGFLMLKKTEKHSYATTRLVLENLAIFHAVSYVWVKQNGGRDICLQKHSYITEEFSRPEFREMIEPSFTILLDMLEMSSDEEKKSCYKIISEYRGKSMDAILDVINQTNDTFNVLGHGDLWNNNMMFTEQKDKIVFIDFQVMRIHSLNLDILYYIYISGGSEARKRIIELLKIYFNKFKNTVEILGESLEFTFEDFLKDFKKRLPFGLVIGLWFNIEMQAMGQFNIYESEGSHIQNFTDCVKKWLQENPCKAEIALKECCGIIMDCEMFKID